MPVKIDRTETTVSIENFISEALNAPGNAIAYQVSRSLATLYPKKSILEVNGSSYWLTSYAEAGFCTLSLKPSIHNQMVTHWSDKKFSDYPDNAWLKVSWQEYSLEIAFMTWFQGGCGCERYWVIADSREIAEEFLKAAFEWDAEIRSEVLVFEDGQWYKSGELFNAIKNTTFENLVLSGSLKQDIQNDVKQFFAARETYEKYGIPWKRGILFVGPPGNGKTHAVKALINAIAKPALYVKSLQSPYGTNHHSIRDVFERARQTTPCLLVLEDLDSMIDDGNRSFFLNELDGFASNTGIVTLATTNHPERLDPAIINRPSRFDRKYHFNLPSLAERMAYIAQWNEAIQPELRLPVADIERVGEATADFSFAYIKELFLSSMMGWIAQPQSGMMTEVMLAQAATLREQMSSINPESQPNAEPV